METTMDTIETKLKQGATPKALILNGFKKSTVYKVDKRLRSKGGLGRDDRTVYLASLIMQSYIDLSLHINENCDPGKNWDEVVRRTNELYTDETGKEQPKELLTTIK